LQLDAGVARKHQTGKVLRTARRRAEGCSIRVVLRPGDKVLQGFHILGQAGPDREGQRSEMGGGDRDKILQGVVAQLLVNVRIDHHRECRRKQKRGSIGRHGLDVGRGELPAGAGSVLHDHGGRIGAANRIRHQARDGVGRSARRKADDECRQLQRLLRARGAADPDKGQRKCGRGERQDISTRMHVSSADLGFAPKHLS
jgi:hypothetical protein